MNEIVQTSGKRGRQVVLPGGKVIHVGGRYIDVEARKRMKSRVSLHDSRYGLNLAQWPVTPPSTSYRTAPAAQAALTNIMLNDVKGCCTQADKFHRQALRQAAGGLPVFNPTNDQVEAAYTRDGGDPGDQGCDEQVVMQNEQNIGDPCALPDSNGNVPIDKSSGFVLVDPAAPGGIALVRACATMFVGGSICMGLPDAWVQSMPSGSGWTWDVPKGGVPAGYFDPANGHCYTLLDQTDQGIYPIGSWGMFGSLTEEALIAGATASDGGALYFVVDREILSRAALLAPDGADWATIEADLVSAGGEVSPS